MSNKRNLWQLYQTATKTATRPSELVGIDDAWLALQLDNAVVFIGNAIENASNELQAVGSGENKEMRPKYTMSQLLDPKFRLPLSDNHHEKETDENSFFGGLIGFPMNEVN